MAVWLIQIARPGPILRVKLALHLGHRRICCSLRNDKERKTTQTRSPWVVGYSKYQQWELRFLLSTCPRPSQ
jgi:hypothetical protein